MGWGWFGGGWILYYGVGVDKAVSLVDTLLKSSLVIFLIYV